MIRREDVKWWILEASKHPESAPAIIEELGERLIELDAQNEHLRNELLKRQSRRAVRGGQRVKALEQQVRKLRDLLRLHASTEQSLILLSEDLQCTRVPLSSIFASLDKGHLPLSPDKLLGLRVGISAGPGDELLLLSNYGRGFKVQALDIPLLGDGESWVGVADTSLESGERLSAVAKVDEQPRFWTFASRKGYVQRFVRAALELKIARQERLFESPIRNDPPIAAVSGDRGDLLLITRWGRFVRFSQRTIEAEGSIALELDPDDEVAAALDLSTDIEVLIATASGRALRRDTEHLKARSQPGGTGTPLVQAHDVLAVYAYSPQAHLFCLTYRGRPILASASDIPARDRSSAGDPVLDLTQDPALLLALLPGVAKPSTPSMSGS